MTRAFTTPMSSLFGELFVDDVAGPPRPVLRPAGSTDPNATRLVVGGALHYFELQPGGAVELAPPLELPLSLHSDPSTRVELLLQLDQSLAPGRLAAMIR